MTIQELKVLITAETQGLQKALKQVQHQMSTMTKKVTNGVKSATSTINKSIHSLEHSFKALGSVLSKALSTTALLLFGRAASRVASDLEEVQNVVDVAFGDMADEVEYFAKRCASAFGLSELQAKKASSTFMAMGKSMGISGLAAKTMALQLAALSGDMASFYNVSQDLADIALKSVFTGETETLKQYGIVMTEANLETYRLAKGLKIKYRDMSQAAKVALRYNYVMEQTALAQGDFTRTSGSWANQLRLLRMQWEELMAAMGVVLNHVLLPIIQALNTILSLLVSIAKGWASMFSPNKEMKEVEKNKGGFAGTSDAINDANKAAKKYRATLAGFDELERLNPEKESSGAGSGAGANIDFDIIEPYDFSAIGGSFEEVQGKLRDLINAFNNGVRELDNKLYNMQTSFKNAGKALGDIVNQIIYGINFGNIGKLIGDGINSINNFIYNALSTIDWYGLGLKLSTGVNSAFERIDWLLMGKTIASKINMIWDTVRGFIDNLNWQLIGEQLSTLILSIFTFIHWDSVITSISDGINNVFKTISQIMDTIDVQLMMSKVFTVINNAIKSIDWYLIGTTIHDAIAGVLDAITFSYDGGSLVGTIGTAIGEAFAGLDWSDLLSKAYDALKTALESFWTVVTGSDAMGSFMANMSIITGAIVALGPIVAKTVMVCRIAFAGLGTSMKTVLTVGFRGIKKGATALFSHVATGAAAMGPKVVGAFTTMGAGVTKAFGALKTGISAAVSFIAANPIVLLVAAIAAAVGAIMVKGDEIQAVFAKVSDFLSNVFAKDWTEQFGVLGNIMNGFSAAVGDIWSGISQVFDGIIDFLRGVFTGDWERVWEGVKKIFKGVWDSFVGIVKAPANIIIGVINAMGSGVTKAFNAVKKAINTLNVHIPDWVPLFGGKSIGFNLQMSTYTPIPKLAHGGVAYESTLAEIGEYKGARSNPEIVAPQSLIKETIDDSNAGLISAMYQMCHMVVDAIDNKDMDVRIGDDTIAMAASRGNQNYIKRTGKPLLGY